MWRPTETRESTYTPRRLGTLSRRRFTFGIIRNIRFTCDLLRPYIACICRWRLPEATHASFQRDCAHVNYAPDVGDSRPAAERNIERDSIRNAWRNEEHCAYVQSVARRESNANEPTRVCKQRCSVPVRIEEEQTRVSLSSREINPSLQSSFVFVVRMILASFTQISVIFFLLSNSVAFKWAFVRMRRTTK